VLVVWCVGFIDFWVGFIKKRFWLSCESGFATPMKCRTTTEIFQNFGFAIPETGKVAVEVVKALNSRVQHSK